MRELAPQSDRGIEKLRELYDRALSMAGYEFHSDRLWQDYIAWEEAQGEWHRVAAIYDRLIRIPTAMYKSHMERFEAIVNMCNPYDLISEDEFNDIFDTIDSIISEEVIEDESAADTSTDADNSKKVIRKKV
ncbi:hypothetical protein TELCIR_18660 [Teladorsagia circumcincta]|uniref:Uncharacterized protein n=1 Tax=Teladorsagia circumcincta TaxID=45464 RepID=A0A2G9TPC7_TELCI|nr:hypothetical protein TELCIR_18660 [Teladorsagia circumcincta]